MSRGNDFPRGEGHKPYYSVSQYKQMKPEMGGCPYQYWLQRRERVWQKPAAWLAHGTAFHTAAEEFERSERTLTLDQAQDAFRDSYTAGIAEACSETPNLSYWFSSGPYRGAADIERRFRLGLEQVAGYLEYVEANPGETIWITPAGEPAIELAFDIELGGIRVVGYIDRMIHVQVPIPKPKSKAKAAVAAYEQAVSENPFIPIPDDLKTGANPGDAFQLAVYDAAVEQMFGVKSNYGRYWMAKRGGPTKLFDITKWTGDAVAAEFQWLDEEIRAERFDPKPEPDKCRRCPVASSCSFSLA